MDHSVSVVVVLSVVSVVLVLSCHAMDASASLTLMWFMTNEWHVR